MTQEIKTSSACGHGCGCSTAAEPAGKVAGKPLVIDFLYLDLESCGPCKSSEANVVAALETVADVIRSTGREILLNRIQVESLEQAVAVGFQTSPTIRVNGRDLQLNYRESHCQSCSEISGTDTNCRVWNFSGQESSTLPKEMLIEAVLTEVYSLSEAGDVPAATATGRNSSLDNLKAFFDGKANGQALAPSA